MSEGVVIALIGATATILAAYMISKKSELKLREQEIRIDLPFFKFRRFYSLY